MTTPDWVPFMRRASAIVTDSGGSTSHAAIVSRELGLPCVVGARTATTTLKDGEQVTVDARAGTVYAGVVEPSSPRPAAQAPAAGEPAELVTATLRIGERRS